jgi:integrase
MRLDVMGGTWPESTGDESLRGAAHEAQHVGERGEEVADEQDHSRQFALQHSGRIGPVAAPGLRGQAGLLCRGDAQQLALLPNRRGHAMTRSNVTQRLALAVKVAALTTPSLAGRAISPHCLRHSTAMHLLQSGVDISVIALWLGHESPATTHQYVEADLAMKEKALARLQDPNVAPRRFRADDNLLKFLKTL